MSEVPGKGTTMRVGSSVSYERHDVIDCSCRKGGVDSEWLVRVPKRRDVRSGDERLWSLSREKRVQREFGRRTEVLSFLEISPSLFPSM